ncbi:MAG: transketolase C-terminal domain-containing protein, partial [Chlamydiota bacterium]
RETEAPTAPIRPRTLGKGEVLVEGKELLLIPLGNMYLTALDIQKRLQEFGISPTIVDLIFINPLDEELLTSLVKKHTYMVTLEEHSKTSGFGTIVQSFLLEKDLLVGKKILSCGIERTFVQHGSVEELKKELGLDALSITEKIVKKFYPNIMYDHCPIPE